MMQVWVIFFCIPPPPGLLPVLGLLEWYMTPTLDSALLISSRAGADLGRTSDRLRSFVNWVSSFPSRAQCFSKAREGGAVEDPSLQFWDEVVRGIRYFLALRPSPRSPGPIIPLPKEYKFQDCVFPLKS